MTRADEQSQSRTEFEKLYKEWYHSAYSQAYRAVRNQAEAEDLTQEAFIRAYSSFATYRGDQPVRNWLRRIMTNLIIDSYRRNQTHQKLQIPWEELLGESDEQDDLLSEPDELIMELENTDPGPEEICLEREWRADLLQAIRQLPDHYRQSIILYYFRQYSCQQIAEATGCSIVTVRVRLCRGRRELRRKLSANPAYDDLRI